MLCTMYMLSLQYHIDVQKYNLKFFRLYFCQLPIFDQILKIYSCKVLHTYMVESGIDIIGSSLPIPSSLSCTYIVESGIDIIGSSLPIPSSLSYTYIVESGIDMIGSSLPIPSSLSSLSDSEELLLDSSTSATT